MTDKLIDQSFASTDELLTAYWDLVEFSKRLGSWKTRAQVTQPGLYIVLRAGGYPVAVNVMIEPEVGDMLEPYPVDQRVYILDDMAPGHLFFGPIPWPSEQDPNRQYCTTPPSLEVR